MRRHQEKIPKERTYNLKTGFLEKILGEPGFTGSGQGSPLSLKSEIDLEDLRDEKIISFSRQNLSYSERYFAEKFEEHDLTDNVTYTCDDTFSLVSLVSAGLGIGFVPEWTMDLPNRGFELKKVRGVDFSAPGDRQGVWGESPLR